ncbi:DUF433 domain-containing protein [Rubrivirga sp.]|uniref:DUF433 domain-containing protein n=1 Tax=Rubrivirga sp. TaxID=1885344 RepID=UPI003B52BD51
MLPLSARPLPLRRSDDGTVRVGGTRVTLDSVVTLYEEGATPEQVVESFPSFDLADVYHTYGYVTREHEAVSAYLRERAATADDLRSRDEVPLGPRLRRRRLQSRQRRGGASEAA